MSPCAVDSASAMETSSTRTPADSKATLAGDVPVLLFRSRLPGCGHLIPRDHSDLGTVLTPKFRDGWTVDKVTATIPTGKPMEGSPSPVPYFHLLERLKTTKREGWRRFGITGCVPAHILCLGNPGGLTAGSPCRGESVADHMYRMSLMSMLAPPSLAPRLDLPRCIQMCLIHDMAESLVGDITPVDGVPRPEKHAREKATMDYISKTLLGNVYGGASDVGARVAGLWQEYEDSQTLESRFVHDIDKMELLLQMVEYEKRAGGQVDLGEFAYIATKIGLPEMQGWAAELLRERDDFWADRKHVHGEAGVAGGVSAELAEKQEEYYRNDEK